MNSNTIIFADLSTYSPKKSITFYESVFGWKYYADHGYYLAYKGNKEIAGLYQTPEKFKQMRMPHFWMTYIQVQDVHETVEKTRKLGGIIELVEEDNPIGGIALIRDPQGAGFTVYAGDKIKTTRTQNEANTLIWNELHISNAANIIPFYQGIFNWVFSEKKPNTYKILNNNNEHVADTLEILNAIKGKYEYWVCTFGVKDLQNTTEKILANGGGTVIDEGHRILFTDDSGEAFFYCKEVR